MQELKNQRVGVSLLGGGMKAVAYIGVLQAFADRGIAIDSLVGASAGALVASCHAFGVSNSSMLKQFRSFRPVGLVNPYKLVTKRRLNYDYWLKHTTNLINPDWAIEASPKKLAIRVIELESSQSKYLTSGPLAGAIIASSAVLGSYKHQGVAYTDGDLIPRTGAEMLRSFGAEVTILVYTDFMGKRDILFPLKVSQQATFERDLIINPPTYSLRLQLANPRLISKRFLSQYYREGYSQALVFLDRIINAQHESATSSQSGFTDPSVAQSSSQG